jgi:hypothetical protein
MVFKKLTLDLFIFSIILFPQHLQAQEEVNDREYHHCLVEENSYTLGFGVPYSFELSAVGFNTRFYHNSGEAFCFGPEFSFFKNEEAEIWDIDFVVHYIIETPWLGIYPVAGINYTKETDELKSEDALGFLWGAGMHRNFKKFTLFAEYTRVESQLRDHFITTGLMYRFKLN